MKYLAHAAAAALALLTGCEKLSSDGILADAHAQAIRDAEEQYRIVQTSGTNTDRCVRAGIVAEAYLQAKNEQKFKEWRVFRDAYCELAKISA